MVTISDVARKAGVSKSTVSRVVNSLPVVDPRTRERVLEAIKELGYAPNGVARGLATRKTGTVGLIMSDIANPFCPDVARGVEDVLREHNYNVILCNTDDRAEKEAEYIKLLVSKRVEGIIFTSVRSGASDLSLLAERDIPFVLASRDIEGVEADVVIADDVAGGYLATRYLITLGHRSLAFIGGPADASPSMDRYKGFEKALQEYSLRCDERFIEYDDFRQSGGYRAAQRLLCLAPRPTAIFAANDLMAIGAMEAVLDAGLRVPEDVSVVGFDDIAISSLHFMQLTTVFQPRYDIGAIAARLLLERVSGKERKSPRRVILPPRLQIRGTCAPCQG